MQVTGKLAKQLSAYTLGMATRAVPVQVSLVPLAQASQSAQQGLVVEQTQHIAWNERFVLALPENLAEQLLTPAPGDNPFEGVALTLKVTVLDGSAERGLGRALCSAEVPVTFHWLLSQIQALINIRTQAAAATNMHNSATTTVVQQDKQPAAQPAAPAAAAANQASDKASEETSHVQPTAGQQAAGKLAEDVVIGLQQTLQMWQAGSAPASFTSQQQAGPIVPADSSTAVTSAAASTAAAPGISNTGPLNPPPMEQAPPVMQVGLKLSLDDSQVTSSWYPHQLMRRRLAQAYGSSSLSSGQQLMRISRSGSRSLATDSKSRQMQQQTSTIAQGTRNALRLEGSEVWCPFSYTSLRRLIGAPAGMPHSGVVPVRAGPGLVIELAYIGERI